MKHLHVLTFFFDLLLIYFRITALYLASDFTLAVGGTPDLTISLDEQNNFSV